MGLLTDAIDLIAQRLPAEKFPTAGRLLLETVQGKSGPISAKDFTPEELQALQRLIEISGDKGYVTYGDYNKAFDDYRKTTGKMPMSKSPSVFSLGDPIGNLQTALGRFRYEKTPQGIRVLDSYDFNPPPANATAADKIETNLIAPFSPIFAIRQYAGEKIPVGKGRPVSIDILRDTTAEPPLFRDTTR